MLSKKSGFYGNTVVNTDSQRVGSTVKKAPSARGIAAYAQRTYENLDFLYANKKKEDA